MHGRLLVLVILTTAISIGCGGGSSANQKVAAGQLAVTPTSLDFDKVPVGTTKGQTAALTAGDSSITVTSADWSGAGYSVSGIVFPVTVPAGQSVHFKVTFAPQAAGDASGEIKFISNAENSPHAALNGSGMQSGTHRITLTWHSNASTIIGFNIYRRSGSQGPYTRINSAPNAGAAFTDASVQAGQTYFYMITSLNKHGKESKYSNQVQVTVPNS
jgi:hypothetical protein